MAADRRTTASIQTQYPTGYSDYVKQDWNLIPRTIVPFIYQERRIGLGSQTGLADTTLSLFFSPKKPTCKVGKLPVNLQFGGRYYADKPAAGPD